MSPISTAFSSVSIPSAQVSGRAALATSSQQLNQDAQQIANPENPNWANPLVDSTRSLPLTEAGAEVIKTADQMLGTMLDTFA